MNAVIAALRECGFYVFLLAVAGWVVFFVVGALDMYLKYVRESRVQRAVAVRRAAIRTLPVVPNAARVESPKTGDDEMCVLYGGHETITNLHAREAKIVNLNATWHEPANTDVLQTRTAKVVNINPFHLN